MKRVWLVRFVEMAVITVALAAVCQELEKPEEERTWHGKVGFIPYDFRLPTIERIKEGYWNADSSQVSCNIAPVTSASSLRMKYSASPITNPVEATTSWIEIFFRLNPIWL